MICVAFSRAESSDQLTDIEAGIARVPSLFGAAPVDPVAGGGDQRCKEEGQRHGQ